MTHDYMARVNHTLDQWLATNQAALHDALDDILDLDTGLADATLATDLDALTARLDEVIDLDAGLRGILPAEANTANRITFVYPDEPPGSEGWFKASKSETVDACVEVKFADQETQVRDSKNPRGPQLEFCGLCWNRFIGRLKNESRHEN